MTFVSFAQNLEDVMLWRALGDIADGFYIDVGASFPDRDSVTRAFYERGWHGINIEPAAQPFARLCEERPRDTNLDVAATESAGRIAFFSIGHGDGLSTLDADLAARHRAAGHAWHQTEARTMPLRAICELHATAPIHFLKIDAEGAEAAVLRGADFGRFRPWIVLVEATVPNSQVPSWEDWEPLLLQAGYGFVYFDGLNRFYVAREHDERLRPSFAAPPNVFDCFVSSHVAAARDEAERLRVAAAQHTALTGDLTLAREQLAAHEMELACSQANLAAATALAITSRRGMGEEIASLMRDSEALRLRLAESERRLDNARLAHRREQHEREVALAGVYASTSWRISAPIRLAGRILTRRKRGPT